VFPTSTGKSILFTHFARPKPMELPQPKRPFWQGDSISLEIATAGATLALVDRDQGTKTGQLHGINSCLR
jgi:hypothetical protein